MFVNKNPQSTLKLGQARGVALMCAARAGIEVGEYAPTLVKKAVVGTGGADKAQVHAMVARLLPGVTSRTYRPRVRARTALDRMTRRELPSRSGKRKKLVTSRRLEPARR